MRGVTEYLRQMTKYMRTSASLSLDNPVQVPGNAIFASAVIERFCAVTSSKWWDLRNNFVRAAQQLCQNQGFKALFGAITLSGYSSRRLLCGYEIRVS